MIKHVFDLWFETPSIDRVQNRIPMQNKKVERKDRFVFLNRRLIGNFEGLVANLGQLDEA